MILASITQAIVGTFLLLVCVLLILVVLVQKGRGGGLAGAFGGAGGHSAFGAKTGDVFTWVTVGLTFAFIVMAVIGNYVFVPPELGDSAANQATIEEPADEAAAEQDGEPAVPPAAAPPVQAPPAPAPVVPPVTE